MTLIFCKIQLPGNLTTLPCIIVTMQNVITLCIHRIKIIPFKRAQQDLVVHGKLKEMSEYYNVSLHIIIRSFTDSSNNQSTETGREFINHTSRCTSGKGDHIGT